MNMSLPALYNPTFLGFVTKNSVNHRAKSRSLHPCSIPVQTCGESENPQEPNKTFPRPRRTCQAPNDHLSQPKTIGVIDESAFSTLIFLEKLVWWGSRCGTNCPHILVCSDTSLPLLQSQIAQTQLRFRLDLVKTSFDVIFQ